MNYRIDDTGELVVSRWPVGERYADEFGDLWCGHWIRYMRIASNYAEEQIIDPSSAAEVHVYTRTSNDGLAIAALWRALDSTVSGDFDPGNEALLSRLQIEADFMGIGAHATIAFAGPEKSLLRVTVWCDRDKSTAYGTKLIDALALDVQSWWAHWYRGESHTTPIGPPNLPPCPHPACQSDRLIALDCYLINVAGPLAEAIDE